MSLGFLILCFVYGAAIGSFLNVVILRLPVGKKINGRSVCGNCKHQLGVADLFPVLSYFWLGGKCRYCGSKFSIRYALVEIMTGVLFALSYAWVQPTELVGVLHLLMTWSVIATCIVVFLIDWDHYLILDKVLVWATAGYVVLFFILQLFEFGVTTAGVETLKLLLWGLLSALPLLFLWAVSKGRWMGFGDVKLTAYMGVVLGLKAFVVGLFGAFLLGSIVSLPLLLTQKKKLTSKIPFGTFLGICTVLAYFYGQASADWYLSIFRW
ncbi:MAG: prepilin peptidase [Candidatus Doudnabacteria bacterium]